MLLRVVPNTPVAGNFQNDASDEAGFSYLFYRPSALARNRFLVQLVCLAKEPHHEEFGRVTEIMGRHRHSHVEFSVLHPLFRM